MAEIIGPDKILADLQLKLSTTKDPAARAAIQEQITARQVEITQQFGGSAGFGGMGYVVPGSIEALKGKTVLAPSFAEGVYSAVKYDPVTGAPIDLTLQKTSDPAAKGTDRYDPNATNLKTYYDASGNPIAPSKLAQTEEGKNMAAAGWDIGYGPGKIGPGPTDFASGYIPPGTVSDFPGSSSGSTTLSTTSATPTGMTQAQSERQSAYDLLFAQFKLYGLESLVEPLKGLITQNISPSEFTIRLRDTDAYKQRFSANQARINSGLRALSEAEYITLEDQYQDVMRRYGLPQSYYSRGALGKQEGFDKFISGDVSPAELEDRIQTAQNRVINAAPEVSTALKQFYPDITNGEILAYTLDPNKAIEEIKRKVTAAEIGAGAMQAGLSTDATRAEELQRYGITGQAARQGYQAIASILPRASQLSDIYKQGPYTQATAESEVFGTTGAADAEKRRKQLAELESAQFSGKTGAVGSALARERAGQF